ncbi:MAG: hypothetical protein ACRAVC_12255 [Trichormus sp.]
MNAPLTKPSQAKLHQFRRSPHKFGCLVPNSPIETGAEMEECKKQI